MVKNSFICITGIDGSGKTTLAFALIEEMAKNGIQYKYVYNRYAPFLLKPIMIASRLIFLHGNDPSNDYTSDTNAKKKLFSNSILSKIYQTLLLFDYSFQIFFKVKIPIILGKNIICDRYIYDTVCTDLATDLNYSNDKIVDMLKICLHIFPKPSKTFLIDISEEIAFNRKHDVSSIEYLKDRRRAYLYMGEKLALIMLDGQESQSNLKHIVLAYLVEGIK